MTSAIKIGAHRVDSNLELPDPSRLHPILADPWVVSSLFHKSVRRGETEIAQRAALTFFKLKGSAIWRRFLVIAFEDVGIGSTEVLSIAAAHALI